MKMNFLIVIVGLLFLISIIIWMLLRNPVFGKAPSGDRLERIKKSVYYKDGQFHNLSPTPALAEGYSMPKVMYDFLFGKKNRLLYPLKRIPTVKENLKNLDKNQDVLVWLGHSSYLLQLDAKTFLVDPVFSSYGAPFKFMNKAFDGTSIYSVDDLPTIDYLVITHDHYDHLDYETILKLKPKVDKVILPLGVGSHFEYWGYETEKLIEEEWYKTVELAKGIDITFTPARHFSGRLFKRNSTLWTSYVLKTSKTNLYLGGDSGYDAHFSDIGQKYGPFDFAILENGQYNEAWHYIHCLPEEVVQAGIDLNARKVIPVHFGKFALAKHAWNEPIIKVDSIAREKGLKILTPTMGSVLNLNPNYNDENKWWLD